MENGAKQKCRFVNVIALLRLPFGLYRMKKWSGGVLILVLVLVLIMSYNLRVKETLPKKQTAYEFFRGGSPESDSTAKNDDSVAPSKMEEKKVPKSVRKPHLVNMEGLSDLYGMRNVSEEEAKALVLWSHLHSLLSRSDAMPETRQGIKEAAVAWKELLGIIEEEKAAKSSDIERLENCPFSVSTLDKTVVSGRSILELPCGLVEDSSITLVGIPHEHHGSFEIELLGSNFAEEAKPPLILHYNVSLPGDNMTVEPFIVQNTWSSEVGWGKAEKCPSHGSDNNLRVDGLSLCNEQGVRSAIADNQNMSLSSGNNLTNTSHGSTHGSSNFPFFEGSPFTATLWAGLEGFHMTVNGRHETSFPYREVRNLNRGRLMKLKYPVIWIFYLLLQKVYQFQRTMS